MRRTARAPRLPPPSGQQNSERCRAPATVGRSIGAAAAAVVRDNCSLPSPAASRRPHCHRGAPSFPRRPRASARLCPDRSLRSRARDAIGAPAPFPLPGIRSARHVHPRLRVQAVGRARRRDGFYDPRYIVDTSAERGIDRHIRSGPGRQRRLVFADARWTRDEHDGRAAPNLRSSFLSGYYATTRPPAELRRCSGLSRPHRHPQFWPPTRPTGSAAS